MKLRLPALLAVFTIALSSLGARSGEIRSLWVLPWSINTPQSIDQVIAKAVANNQTEILVEVRYRSDALYKTNRVEDEYPNPEPQSYILNDSDFDPLAYAITEGHKQNLNVQAWVIVFNSTPLLPELLAKNYMYRNHREWFTWDSAGRSNGKNQEFGYFIDPGIPDVQTYLLNVLGDITSGYPDLDGIHLDYIRYPNAQYGYHPISKARFNLYREQGHDIDFNQWRVLQVTQFVEKLHAQTRRINPKLLLTAAVFADYNDALKGMGQDWLDWLNRGIIDRVYPMHYQRDDAAFFRVMNEIRSFYHNDKIVMGLRAWDAAGKSLLADKYGSLPSYNINNLIDRVNWTRDANFAGIALFSYDGLQSGNALDYLGATVFKESGDELAFLNESGTGGTAAAGQQVDQKPEMLAPDITIVPLLEQYSLYIFVPSPGRWNIEIYDNEDKLIYQRSRFYDSGANTDHWDGVISDGSRLGDGDYYARLYRENDRFIYSIPVSIERIWE